MAFTPKQITKELDMANLAKHNDNYNAIKTELDVHDAHVAAQTAHGSTSAAVAGKIMQRDSEGRAKVGAPAAADDIARKAEVDAVQDALDTHEADADVHLSAADRSKLDGIEPGAEPNQNAFAQVNNVVAGAESDTLTIAGGTGITVTTNPTTKTVTVTATGDATPGAHGSSHNNDGADPIPDLVALRGEFDSLTAADIGAETPEGAQAKVDALAGEGNTKTVAEVAEDVADVTAQLAETAKVIDQPLVGRYKTVKEDDQYNAWPILVKTNTGRFISIYSVGSSHRINDVNIPGRKLCYKYSDNNGLTWSDEVTMLYDPDIDYQSYAAIALSDGSIICIAAEEVMENEVAISVDYLVMKSVDNGLNFTEVWRFSQSTDPIVRGLSYTHMPVEMDNGKIIAAKHLRSGSYVGLAFIFSDDGVTWDESVTVIPPTTNTSYAQIPYEVRIAYIGGGKLVAIGRNDSGNVYQLTSNDYGETWTRSTTNIADCRDNCLYPLYFSDDNTITLYYNDRYSNTVKKRTVPAQFIYDNPTQWTDPTILDYSSSSASRRDSGYITACRISDNKKETMLCMYTTRNFAVGVNDPQKTAVVIVYDTVEQPRTEITKSNIFINGGFSIWQTGTSFSPADGVQSYTADQWIFKGTGSNTISRSTSPNNGKYVHVINATNSDTVNKLYQPVVGLSANNYTLTVRINPTLASKIRLYLRYTQGGAVVETTSLSGEKSIVGFTTISFSFRRPPADVGTPIFIGIEMEGKTTISVYDLKLEEGLAFTGFDEVDEATELMRCLPYYEEFKGIMSYPARTDYGLTATVTFTPKRQIPIVTVYFSNNANTARGWVTSDVGTIPLTVSPVGLNHARFYGQKPAGASPIYYDVDRIVVDARIY